MPDPSTLHVVLGAGPSGRGVAARLYDQRRRVRVVTRSGKAEVPRGVETLSADIANLDSARDACRGATVVYGCVGLPSYVGWSEKWPPIMRGMLAGAEAAGARLVFMDNVYMYGPVDGPLREDLPLTERGTKPALRSRLTRMWQEAHAAGRVRAVAVRASDFYGPGVRAALLGDFVTRPAVQGKAANLLGDPSMAHTFTYMADVVRALVDVADADDDVLGQAWHVPSAPARPVSEVVEMIYREAGQRPRFRAAGRVALTLLGLFNPEARELRELLHQWDRPFEVDDAKFAARFWKDYTPLAEGIRETVRWFRANP